MCVSYLRHLCLRNACFRNSHRRNPSFRNCHLSRIQAPLKQTPLGLPPRKTTHPNKNSLHKQLAQTLLPLFSLFYKGKKRTVCTTCSETVCANCVFYLGVFWGGGHPLHDLRAGPKKQHRLLKHKTFQRQKSAQGILRLRNPNLGPNSGKRILDARILDPNSRVEFFDSVFSSKRGPLKNSPSRNSPPEIHIEKFTPEFGPKNSHCTSAGPFC